MRLLVVGGQSQTRGFFQALAQQDGQQVTFCSSASEALAQLRRGTLTVDWIAIGELPEAESLIGQLQALGIEAPVLLCREASGRDRQEIPQPLLLGLFERSPYGLSLLSCNLAGEKSERCGTENVFAGNILYEYHAPCCE